jgi:ribonuclease BN (tRNA processing enzyme)
MNRRTFLASTLALAGAGRMPTPAIRPPRTRLILLGTGGGPLPRPGRSASAQVIVVGATAYVVDCGDGVARQLAAARVPFATMRHIFITHQHSDHTADYGNLLLLGWTAGLPPRVDTWGPPPLERMTKLFLEMYASDIEVRVAGEGRTPLAPLIHVHELAGAGPVMQDERVRVTAALVHHPRVAPAFAYRFDTDDRSIVISGDTSPSDNLIRLARGADVLVHEAMYGPAVDRLAASVPQGGVLKQHLLASHTLAEDAGRIAREAGIGMLVLSHLVPADDPAVTEAMWVEAVRRHFTGRIVVGRDLMEL